MDTNYVTDKAVAIQENQRLREEYRKAGERLKENTMALAKAVLLGKCLSLKGGEVLFKVDDIYACSSGSEYICVYAHGTLLVDRSSYGYNLEPRRWYRLEVRDRETDGYPIQLKFDFTFVDETVTYMSTEAWQKVLDRASKLFDVTQDKSGVHLAMMDKVVYVKDGRLEYGYIMGFDETTARFKVGHDGQYSECNELPGNELIKVTVKF